MEHLLALGRAAKKWGEMRAPGDLDADTPGAVQAPAASEQVPPTTRPSHTLAGSRSIAAGILFLLWYSLTAIYNITHKIALHALPLPWSIAAAQLVAGPLLVLPLWVSNLRAAPARLTMADVEALSHIAVFHMLTHVCATLLLGAGANSTVNTVKAAEPLFTALYSATYLKQTFPPLVYLTLVPVIAGVGLTTFISLEFDWPVSNVAVLLNMAASMCTILSKGSMGMDVGKNMNPANLYAVVHIMAAAMFIPLAIIMEGPMIKDMWAYAVTTADKRDEAIFNIVASGILFYLYNEVAFRCLGRVHPVTHAVGSSFKRIFLVATSFFVFGVTPTLQTAVGSYVAIVGVQLYRLTEKW